jgi:small multidrug resistance pump
VAWTWLSLLGAILFEVAGTTCMKLAQGFARPAYAWAMFGLYAVAFTLLTFALKRLDVSVAYAIWAGLGMALIAVIGIVAFDERLTWLKALSLVLIVAGVVGLNLGSGGRAP